MKETIYLYHIPKEKLRKLQVVLMRLRIKAKAITEDMIYQQVGFIADIDGFQKTDITLDIEPINDEVMIMKGLSHARMDNLFAEMKKARIPSIPLKAVLTETNQQWTFYDLYLELQKEHLSFQKNKEPLHTI